MLLIGDSSQKLTPMLISLAEEHDFDLQASTALSCPATLDRWLPVREDCRTTSRHGGAGDPDFAA